VIRSLALRSIGARARSRCGPREIRRSARRARKRPGPWSPDLAIRLLGPRMGRRLSGSPWASSKRASGPMKSTIGPLTEQGPPGLQRGAAEPRSERSGGRASESASEPPIRTRGRLDLPGGLLPRAVPRAERRRHGRAAAERTRAATRVLPHGASRPISPSQPRFIPSRRSATLFGCDTGLLRDGLQSTARHGACISSHERRLRSAPDNRLRLRLRLAAEIPARVRKPARVDLGATTAQSPARQELLPDLIPVGCARARGYRGLRSEDVCSSHVLRRCSTRFLV